MYEYKNECVCEKYTCHVNQVDVIVTKAFNRLISVTTRMKAKEKNLMKNLIFRATQFIIAFLRSGDDLKGKLKNIVKKYYWTIFVLNAKVWWTCDLKMDILLGCDKVLILILETLFRNIHKTSNFFYCIIKCQFDSMSHQKKLLFHYSTHLTGLFQLRVIIEEFC